MSLAGLIDDPFELLLEMERRAKASVVRQQGTDAADEVWIGIGFRLGSENFVAARSDVREVLPVPEHITRVPGAKTWLRGVANVRGQLITIVDLRSFLGGGRCHPDRHTRVLHLASRELPTAVIVDEVLGFRRFPPTGFDRELPDTALRTDRYLSGRFQHGGEVWPLFGFSRLLDDELFQRAGEKAVA